VITRYEVLRGVRSLFSRPDGTGKTLAAEVPAARIALNLQRMELDASVSKDIGEAEKNLHSVFDRVEAANTYGLRPVALK
jgi:SpoVK/Ycf46/Vps4 family AAA+-type ATPase